MAISRKCYGYGLNRNIYSGLKEREREREMILPRTQFDRSRRHRHLQKLLGSSVVGRKEMEGNKMRKFSIFSAILPFAVGRTHSQNRADWSIWAKPITVTLWLKNWNSKAISLFPPFLFIIF